MKPLRIALVGCGHISAAYGEHIKNHPGRLELAGASDLAPERAEAFCRQYGGRAYRDFDALLGEPEVDVVLNLTVHHAHFELNRRALRAGKHVYTEKPMALTHAQAGELVGEARRAGRLLGAAPITFLGEGIQTAAKFLETGRLGALRLVYAEVNWGQIERWISAPAPYFTVGPLLDVGVYAICALAYLLGPIRRVWGYSTILKTPRLDRDGLEFSVTAPDFTTGMMEFENGVVARLTTNYYTHARLLRHLAGFEFHGDEGSFIIDDYHDFDGACHFAPYAEGDLQPVPLLRAAAVPMDRALGLAEMADALAENRPLRNSPEMAAHVIEVMEGLQKSAAESRAMDIRSRFDQPPLMEWAKNALIQNRASDDAPPGQRHR